MRQSRWIAAAAGCALACATPALAVKPWAQVEDGYPEAFKQLELELTLGLGIDTPQDSSFMGYSWETELEYGLSEKFTGRIKGTVVYEDNGSSSDTEDSMHFDGGGIEGQYYFTNPNIDPVGISVIGSVELGENTFVNEDFLVIQKDWEKFIGAYNLGVAIEVGNLWDDPDGEGRVTDVTLINSAGLDYLLTPKLKIGADIALESTYSEGRVYSGSRSYVGPVINWVPNDKLWITAGVEFELTNSDDEPRTQFSLIIGYYF